MPFILILKSGSKRATQEKYERDIVLLGRKPDNDVVFADDVVSNHHAEIRRVRAGYQLSDLGSSNGTFVNGERVEKKILQDGDIVQVGKRGPEFEFRITEESKSERPSLIPLSGDWESGRAPVKLSGTAVSLGRSSQNDIVLGHVRDCGVSRQHCRIEIHADRCRIEDLESSNGTLVNGRSVSSCSLKDGDVVRLGPRGPEFEFRWHRGTAESRPKRSPSAEQILERLERASKAGTIGESMLVYWKVANRYYRRRRRPLLVILGFSTLIILAGGIFTLSLWRRMQEEKKQVANFYEWRMIESGLLSRTVPQAQVEGKRQRRRALMDAYSSFVDQMPWYARKSEQEKAILRLARRLGEADLLMPPDFVNEVGKYVNEWKSTSRLRDALKNGRDRKLIDFIKDQLHKKDLPPEFVYIPLVESDFLPGNYVQPDRFPDPGGIRKFGIAKGLWMFIPTTASEYGLRVGPYANEARYDPLDERHDPTKSTYAAMNYLSELYITKARASGLLVLACYNYGPTRINKNLDEVSDDPRERNFWNFYQKGWIPKETREYVMRIFTSALICENPKLFGFSDYFQQSH